MQFNNQRFLTACTSSVYGRLSLFPHLLPPFFSLSSLSRVDGVGEREQWGWRAKEKRRNRGTGKGGGGGGGRAHEGYKYIIISYTARIFVKYAKRIISFSSISLSLSLAHTLSLSLSISLARRVGIIDLYFFFFPFLHFVIVSFIKC